MPKPEPGQTGTTGQDFIFYIEEVWRLGDGFAVSGRMVQGAVRGECDACARRDAGPIVPVRVLGLAKARTSRLERALTLRVRFEGEASRLRGAYLLGSGKVSED